jgi:uncharacterized surface protein with fasciclin (FAS1) repeats
MRKLLLILAALAVMFGAVIPAAAAQDDVTDGSTTAAGTRISGETVGTQDPATGEWFLRDADGNVTSFYFGDPNDWALMGDWDADGIDTPGTYRQSDGRIYLRNSNTQGVADYWFNFGNPGDVPLPGDFDGDGYDTISVYRPSTGEVFIINELGADGGGLGAADYSFLFGNPGDDPFTGDFDGDGIDSVGLHRASTGEVYFRNALSTGVADSFLVYGNPGDQMFAGDWNADGTDTLGVFRSSTGTMYLRNSNTSGVADQEFSFGSSGQRAVAGNFSLLNIVETAKSVPQLSTLVAALEATEGTSNLATALSGPGPFTVFAPTNDAFAALGTDTLNALLADPGGALTDILTYHVASGTVPASEVVELSSVETLNGQDIWISVVDGKVILNPGTPSEAEVIITDVYASNGVVHVIDAVLQPLDIVDTAIAAGFDTLVAALTQAKLVETLQAPNGPYTVFAPTDEAFAQALADLGLTADELLASKDLTSILTYHVLGGEYDAAAVVGWAGGPSPATVQGQNLWVSVVDGRVFINAGTDSVAEVILTDIQTTNGIIHVIDYVLQPLDIVDTAIAAGFDVLVAALSEAELVEALQSPNGPYTVFAPTDEAFSQLLTDLGITAEELLANPELANILLYHVTDGTITAADVAATAPIKALPTLNPNDATLKVEVIDGKVVINSGTANPATVILADVFATNGVIHVIDGVLIPPAMHAR